MGLGLVIDPITRDLVDDPGGGPVETADARTVVLWQLEQGYGSSGWWGDPTSGSLIRDVIRGPLQGDMTDVRNEALRALHALVREGRISDLSSAIDQDEVGRPVLALSFRDPAGANLVDLAYVPAGF